VVMVMVGRRRRGKGQGGGGGGEGREGGGGGRGRGGGGAGGEGGGGQRSEDRVSPLSLEASGLSVAREAEAQGGPRSAKLLRPREPEKRRKSARTEPSQQGFQDRRQAQNENIRR
jgi:hypothetical protein